MSNYYHDVNYHPRKRYVKRVKKLVIFLLLVIILIIAILIIDSFRENAESSVPSKLTGEVNSVFAPKIEVFQTEYFQFEANKHWKFIANESDKNKFVYRSFNQHLVEHQLNVYVNDPVAELEATRVLPVTIKNGTKFEPLEVSEHCAKSVAAGQAGPRRLVLSTVSFMCLPNSVAYKVSVGLKDGQSPIEVTRPNGARATYGISYLNVTYSPNDQQIMEIMKTFQIR